MKTGKLIIMLDAGFKGLCIVSPFVGRDQGVVLVKDYDRKTFYPMLVKCYKHLHPLVRLDRNCVNQNIFEQIASTSEPTKKLVIFMIFKRYQLNVNDIKCPP